MGDHLFEKNNLEVLWTTRRYGSDAKTLLFRTSIGDDFLYLTYTTISLPGDE